jgi:hypothetical protein
MTSSKILYKGIYSRAPGDSINEVLLNTENSQYCPGNVRESIRFTNFKFTYPSCAQKYNVDLVAAYDRLFNCHASNQTINDLLSATLTFIARDVTEKVIGELFMSGIFYDTGSGTLPADSIQSFYTASSSGIFKNVKKVEIEFKNNPKVRIVTFFS